MLAICWCERQLLLLAEGGLLRSGACDVMPSASGSFFFADSDEFFFFFLSLFLRVDFFLVFLVFFVVSVWEHAWVGR